MLALATDHSTAYVAGNLIAIVLLAAGALWLGLRALDRKGRRAAAAAGHFTAPAAPLATPVPAATDSVAPPGFAEPQRTFVAPAAPSARRGGRSRRTRMTDAIAAGVCAALCVGAIVHVAGGEEKRTVRAWDTQQGRLLHAGFVAGCERQDAPVRFDCECVFERLTSAPPFDTPAGFANLPATMAQVRTAADLPSGIVTAGRDCIRD